MTVSEEMIGARRVSRGPLSKADTRQAPEANVPIAWVNRALSGRYRVLDTLGQGAMGTVFLAEHVGLSMPVALKVIHPRLSGNAAATARFRREAHLVSRINHPNVVSIVDFGLLEERVPFLVMQLVRGTDLRQVMASEQPLPWPAAAAIGSQICDALAAARMHGIIHRDIKPANVVLQPVGKGREPLVKLLDFGIAKLDPGRHDDDGAAHAQLTPLGVIVGTPGYMAPEQHVGEQVTHRSDLYALGVVLWELMTGRRLFQSSALVELLSLQMCGPQRCEELRAYGVPGALEQLVARLLSYSALDRPESANEVGAALRSLTQASDIGSWGAEDAEVSTKRTILVPEVEPGSQDAPPTRAASPAARRGKAWSAVRWVATTVLALVAIVLLAWPADNTTIKTAGMRVSVPPTVLEPPVLAPLSAPAALHRNEGRASAPEIVPAYADEIAAMQGKRTCREKRKHLRRVVALGDAGALPYLQRLSERPYDGCGTKRTADCLGCMRSELAAAVAVLSQRARNIEP